MAIENDEKEIKHKKKKRNFSVEELSNELGLEEKQVESGNDSESAGNWKKDLAFVKAEEQEEFLKFIEKNEIESDDLDVVLSDDIEATKKETVYPFDNLLYLGNINSNFEDTEWGKVTRLKKVEDMVRSGFDVEMLGIKTFRDSDKNFFYLKDLESLNLELVRRLARELDDLERKTDFSDASDELKRFLGDNLEKVEAEYVNIRVGNKEREDKKNETPIWLVDVDEDEEREVDKSDWPSWLREEGEDDESEHEKKNSLPTEMGSNLEEGGDEDVLITHVLALDIIQRIHYSKEGEKARIPILKGGKIDHWENLDVGLDLLVEDEGGEVFKALAIHFWKDLAIHGILKEGKEEGEKTLLKTSDLDGEICKYLFKATGVDTRGVSYRNHEDDKMGAIHADMGNKDGAYFHVVEKDGVFYVTTYLDHHDPKSKSDMSAAGWVFSGLSKLGLIDNPGRYLKMVDFINKKDNGLPPMEMEELLKKHNKETGENFTRREYVLLRLYQTAWGLKQYIKAPNFIEFFENGGDPMKILEEKDLWKLGVKYNPDKKKRPEFEVDKQKVVKEHIENSLMELQIAENEGHVFESSEYGKILVDIGRKMGGLGNELSRACGYDGFLSWDPDKNSFMLTTNKKLEVRFNMGTNVREHMWIKKPEMDGVLETEGYKEILRILNGGVEGKWSNGLRSEAVKIEDGGDENKEEKEKKNSVWNDETYNQMYVGGYKPNSEEGKVAIEALREKGIDLEKIFSDKKELAKMAVAISIAHNKRILTDNFGFTSIGDAEKYIQDYFGVVEEGKIEEKETLVWDDDVWKDFYEATSETNSDAEFNFARKRLADRKIDLKKVSGMNVGVRKQLSDAIIVAKFNKQHNGMEVAFAKQLLREYFGVEGEEKKEGKTAMVDEKKKTREERDILDEYLYAGGLMTFSGDKSEMKKNIKVARIRAVLDDIYEAVTRKDEKARERLSAVGIKLLSEDINEEVLNALKTREKVEGKLWGNFGSVEKAEEFLISAFKIDNALKILVDHYREVGEKKEAVLRNRMEAALSKGNLRLLRNWTIAKERTKGFDLAKIEEELRKKGFDLSMLGGNFVEDIREALNKIDLDKSEIYKTKKAAQDRLMVFYKVGELEDKKEEEKQSVEKRVEEMVVNGDRDGLANMIADGTDEKMFYWAVGIMTGGAPNAEFPTAEKAREYFMAHVKTGAEKKLAPEAKLEKAESRRMEVGAMFAQYEKISMNKDLWKKWRARIEDMEETSPEREYAIKQLQATIYLYNNPLERIKHDEYWRLTGMAIMRDLRAIEI